MAQAKDLPSLLASLTETLSAVSASLPDSAALAPPDDGISLFDTKNELLLAYLQNLVFLIYIKLQNLQSETTQPSDQPKTSDITKKLLELRLYLEKGVRPLEGKLKYQLDKLLATASDADAATAAAAAKSIIPNGRSKTEKPTASAQEDSSSDSEDQLPPANSPPPPPISDLSYRPNPSDFVLPSRYSRKDEARSDGIYRPPRVAPTALPTTDRALKRAKPARKSAAVDSFIREEMTDAPVAEPSIGAGSRARGKAKEREDERQAYEEQRLMRLPSEKKQKRRVGGGEEDFDVGGFDGLGDVDFGDLKGGKKRRRDGGGGGERIGERWEKRVKKGLGRKRR